jgi:hypothetical protein
MLTDELKRTAERELLCMYHQLSCKMEGNFTPGSLKRLIYIYTSYWRWYVKKREFGTRCELSVLRK